MSSGRWSMVKALYTGCGSAQRLHNFFRIRTCPFGEIEKYVSGSSEILDLGCGVGLFANYLAAGSDSMKILGVDLSEKKIEIARGTVKDRPNLRFEAGDISDLGVLRINPLSFDCILLIDSLYLLPLELQQKTIETCHTLLKEQGTLMIKKIDVKPFWKYGFSMVQDYFAIRALKLYTSRDLRILEPSELTALMSQAGLSEVKRVDLSQRSLYLHLLFVGTKFSKRIKPGNGQKKEKF